MATRAILIVVVAFVILEVAQAQNSSGVPQAELLLVGEYHHYDQDIISAIENEATRGEICLAVERGELTFGAEKPLDEQPNTYGLEEKNVYALTVTVLDHIEALTKKSKFKAYNWAASLKYITSRQAAWKRMKRPFPDPTDEQLALKIDNIDLQYKEDLNSYHYTNVIRVNRQLSYTLLDMLKEENQTSNFLPEHQSLFNKALSISKLGPVHKRFETEVALNLRNKMFANVITPVYHRCSPTVPVIKVITGYEHVPGLKDLLEKTLPGVVIREEYLPAAQENACKVNHELCTRKNWRV